MHDHMYRSMHALNMHVMSRVCGGKRMRRTAVKKKKKIKLLCKLETWTGSFVWHRMNADFLAVSLKVLGSNAPVSLWHVFVCMFLLCLDGYPLVTHASSYSSKPFMILNWLWVWMCRGSVICPGYTLPPTPWQLGEAPSSARISGSKWWLHFILLGSTCTEVRTVYVKDGQTLVGVGDITSKWYHNI